MTLAEESLKMHKDHQGKLATMPKVPLNDRHDLGVAYTPGVAAPCMEIHKDKDLSFTYTCRGNMVAVVSDGTRVLGLGNIGPEAALPVMEGKSLLFKMFGDIDAVPICIDTTDKDKLIETIRLLQPTFAGINLEDIESPKCYDVEDALKEIMDIPVFHDDQHGTAIVAMTGVLGALRFVKKDLKTARIVVNGAGAAGSAIGRLLVSAGAQNLIMVDINGALYEGMSGLNRIQEQLAKNSNPGKIKGTLAEVAVGADVLFGVSKPGAFTAAIIQSMGRDPIVFAMANPVPEISYEEAKAAGARVVGTGRSDAPNQVNNVLVFPGLFRGAIDVRSRKINEEMKVAAAYALTELIPEAELREDYIIVDVFSPKAAPAVAAAVAAAAMKTGVARVAVDPEVIRDRTAARVAFIKAQMERALGK